MLCNVQLWFRKFGRERAALLLRLCRDGVQRLARLTVAAENAAIQHGRAVRGRGIKGGRAAKTNRGHEQQRRFHCCAQIFGFGILGQSAKHYQVYS